MSCWLYMQATFKVRCGTEEKYLQFKETECPNLIGKWIPESLYLSDNEEACRLLKEAYDTPHDYVPFGSEGTAQVEIGELQPDVFGRPNYFTVTLTGSLRDRESFKNLKNWFNRACLNLKGFWWLDYATCTGKLSWFGETLFMRFDDSGMTTVVFEEEDFDEEEGD